VLSEQFPRFHCVFGDGFGPFYLLKKRLRQRTVAATTQGKWGSGVSSAGVHFSFLVRAAASRGQT